MIPPYGQAHLQFTQANALSKNCKRACPSNADFADTKKTKSFKTGKWNVRIEKLSQTIGRQERPVGNTVYKKLGR